MGSFVPTAGTIDRQWHVIDAGGQVLGRVATEAARLLQGKHKPIYTPHIDTGDHVVIVNAATVRHDRAQGRTEAVPVPQRVRRRTARGTREGSPRQKNPRRLVEEAVRGMLPKTTLGEAMWRKLKVYADEKHPHQAQQPRSFAVTSGPGKKAQKDKDKLIKREVA